jgi:LysR family nitrogen assimilation transcriptional regulator
LELRQLRYSVAIVDHGSLSRAAPVLHVAQSALTQQLRQPEEELGAQLLLPRATHPKSRCR